MNGVHVKLTISEEFLKNDLSKEIMDQGKLALKFHFDKEKIYNVINTALPDTIRMFCKTL